MTQLGRHVERSLQSLAQEAPGAALRDAGASIADIGQAFHSAVTQGPPQGQYAAPGEVLFAKLGLVSAIDAALCRFWMKTLGTTHLQIAAVS